MTASRPFEKVAIDLVGPCGARPTLEGNTYILTMLDTFTRWAIAIPIPSKSAEVVAHAIMQGLITKHGCPAKIFSDLGTEFINKGLRSMCARWGFSKMETTGWQPRSNPVERIHRWINGGMTSLQAKFGSEWDKYVDAVVFAYNVSIHDSTNYSPYSLLYGRQPSLPEDVMLNVQREAFPDEEKYGISCSKWMAAAYKEVIKRQHAGAQGNQLCRVPYHMDVNFKVGDSVLYWQPSSSKQKTDGPHHDTSESTTTKAPNSVPGKWKPQWTGPHVVTRRHNKNHFEFESAESAKKVLAHVNRLCHFYPWSDSLPSTSPELDARTTWTMGGVPDPESLMIIDLDMEDVPFGVGKMTGFTNTGHIEFVWMGNKMENARGTFKPGWVTADNEYYYDDSKRHKSHRAYTGTASETTLKAECVILHGFKLTPALKLPIPVLRAVSSSGRTTWSLPKALM